jgi:LysM repeat protein
MRSIAFCFCLVLVGVQSAYAQTPDERAEKMDTSALQTLLEQQARQLNTLQDRILRLQEMVALLLARPSSTTISATSSATSSTGPAETNASQTSLVQPSASPRALGSTPESDPTFTPAITGATLNPAPLPNHPVALPPANAQGTESATGLSASRQTAPQLPAVPVPQHLVEKGQTLISIAKQHGVSVTELQKLNRIEDVRKLQVGQRLLLPTPSSEQKTP